MKPEVTLLIRLQEVDTEIMSLRKEKVEIPRKIKTLTEELNRAQSALQHEIERAEMLEKEKKGKESKLKDEEERLGHSEKKLTDVKTNKEYQAALKEIDEHKEANSRLEEQILVTMEQLDALKGEISEKEKELSGKSVTIQADIDALTEKARQTEDQVAEKEKIRKKLAGEVDPPFLATYERLTRAHQNGPVLVKVKKGVCKGCFMNLPPQFFNEMLRDKDIKTCPNCARLIYLDEDPEVAAPKENGR